MDPAFALVANLGDASEKVGVVAAATAAAAVLVLRPSRLRSLAIASALLIVPAVLVGHIWNSPQFRSISDNGLLFAGLVVYGVVLVGALAVVFLRRPHLFPLLAVAALPFRVPIDAGGSTANLLVPLYVVIASASVAEILRQRGGSGAQTSPRGPPLRLLQAALGTFILIYAFQALYSRDFDTALEQMVFFYVPFALLFKLLVEARWTRSLLIGCGAILLCLALVFTGIGFWEYHRHELFWNPKVIRANQFESYFRVNSVFWDPNVYGRFLAIVMVTVTGLMLWSVRRRLALGGAVVLAILWGGLVLTFSQSSFASLLLGLAVLAALRWNARRAAALSAIGFGLGALFLLTFQDTLKIHLGSSSGLNKATSGRADLIEGGVNLFLDRPLWGYGSGSFARTFRLKRKGNQEQATSASHTLPITVAAEQGVVGLAAYALILLAAFRLLLGETVRIIRSARGPPAATRSDDGSYLAGGAAVWAGTAAALTAAFAVLVTHTMMYAAFLEDPFTWVILAIAAAIVPLAERAERLVPARRPVASTAPATA